MKFGIFYEHQLPRPWGEDDEHKLYKDALDQIELADRLGFDHVWEVEHHFLEEYSHSSAPEVFLGAASQRTSRIRIGHGIVQLPVNFNHTARIAERIATLDLVSDGRVEFGTGPRQRVLPDAHFARDLGCLLFEALAAHGWRLTDPAKVAGSPQAYRRFIQGSRGELGIAKSGYVEARCGWFSDRSVCYLASGRPVIAQETGFSDVLPVGAGLFSFETGEDVEGALEELARDYEGQRRAARAGDRPARARRRRSSSAAGISRAEPARRRGDRGLRSAPLLRADDRSLAGLG